LSARLSRFSRYHANGRSCHSGPCPSYDLNFGASSLSGANSVPMRRCWRCVKKRCNTIRLRRCLRYALIG
jgi:hypothetical protein